MSVADVHEAAADFQRWEWPSMDAPAEPVPEAAPEQPTVQDLQTIEQQAREEGRAAGLAEGLAAAEQQLRQRMAQLDALYEAAVHPLLAFDEQTAEELARLAMVVARRVVAHELQLNPELIARAVREAANALPAATRELRIYLHPDDLALVRALDVAERDWQLLADPSLARGDCRMENERSRLDARVETRLAAAVDAVLGEAARPEFDVP